MSKSTVTVSYSDRGARRESTFQATDAKWIEGEHGLLISAANPEGPHPAYIPYSMKPIVHVTVTSDEDQEPPTVSTTPPQTPNVAGLHAYITSREIAREDHPFYALIMAAMREADSTNAAALNSAFPEVWAELQVRYDAPGGELEGDR